MASTSTLFSIAYDGPMLKTGQMDVRDLAPALLAVGELMEASNKALNGDVGNVNVKVTATRQGSFEIQLLLDALNIGWSWLDSPQATKIINLGTMLGFIFGGAAGGLIALLKFLSKRKPEEIVDNKNGTTTLVIEKQTLVVHNEVIVLWGNLPVRRGLERLIYMPLLNDGIDLFRAKFEEVSISVTREESKFLVAPELPEVILVEEEHERAFSIVTLAFEERRKWRLNDGNTSINVVVDDEEFLKRVDNNIIRFAKHDILKCQVKFIQKQTSEGLKTEYIVTKVLQHIPAARQLHLALDEEE